MARLLGTKPVKLGTEDGLNNHFTVSFFEQAAYALSWLTELTGTRYELYYSRVYTARHPRTMGVNTP